MAKKIRVWDGSAWQDVAPALPYTAVHSAQASMPSTAVDGQIWLDTDASVPSTSVTRWYKLPSAGTTTLSGNDDNSIPLAYTPGYEQVFLNGTLLSRSAADYTATTGTSVVLSSAIVAGDIVEIICPLQITTTDTYTQSATNAAFQANTNNFSAGKNKIINGDFGIWQRGTSFTPTSGSYTADRWQNYFDGSGATRLYSRQAFTPGTAPVTGYEGAFFLRLNKSVAGSGETYNELAYKIESSRTLAGQTATVSFWAKCETNTVLQSLMLRQVFGSGGFPSGQVDLTLQSNISIGTSWTRYTFTYNLPSISGKTLGTADDGYLQLIIKLPLNSTFTFDIWGVQVEAGSSATAFQTSTGTFQGELAACQRYYYRWTSGATYARYPTLGVASSTTIGSFPAAIPVTMRITPYSVEYGGNFRLFDMVNTPLNMTSIALFGTTELSPTGWINIIVASGLTQLRTYSLNSRDDVSAYIGLNAEL
jgi:hypothetical protein